MILTKNSNGEWIQVAGNGKAEYGASTVRTGTITTEEIGIGGFAVFTVTFDTPMPDSDYRITWDWNTAGGNITFAIVTITEKTANGFKLYVRNSDATANPLTSHVLTWYAFKLYTDTEYNSVLALEDRVSELETQLEELVLGGVIEADTLPAVPDNYIYNVKNATTIGALFSDIFDYGSVSSGAEYIKKLSKYYVSGNASIWQDDDEWGKRLSGTLIFDVPITVPEMVVDDYTFPAGDVSKINIRDGEWNGGGYDGCEFVYTDGSVVGSTNEYGLMRSFAQRADQIIINVPKVYSKGTQLVTMQDFNIFKNSIS